MPPAPQQLQPGEILGDGYVIEQLLGGGGMGEVYLARDPRLDRLVAIKLLHAEVAASEEAEDRFRREARALSRVVHPNIVGIHAFGRREDTWFLVMEYVEGHSLEEEMKEGPLPLREVLSIARQVASGLQEAHVLGIVHRDIKPGNILLRPLASGGILAKVVDFGLARQFDAQKPNTMVTRETTILGTPSYMSPEQIQSQPIDGRSDLYSLAIMIYQMLTGQLPFKRDTLQGLLIAHLIDEPPSLKSQDIADLPANFERELRRGLSKAATDRHATVVAFAEALESAADLTTQLVRPGAVACPGCNQPSMDAGGFCARCGCAVPQRVCGACGAKREGERYHCSDCGASLLAWAAPSAAVSSGLRLASAAVVIARIDRGEGDGGSIDMQAQLDFGASFTAAIGREGGRAMALLGHEGIALFGLGGMREGDLASAVDAALGLQSLYGNTETGQRAEVQLRIGVELGLVGSRGSGVAYGMALVGGDTVEVARQAALRAPQGSVVVGEAAFREVRGLFEVRLDTQRRRRVVLRRRDASLALADYIARDVAQPFIGRNPELALLLRSARKVRRERSLVAAPVLGPSAIGKSRLVGELLRRLEDTGEPWRFDVVRCSQNGAPTAWQPFLDIVREAITSDGKSDINTRISRLPGLDDGDPERLARRVQALVRMLGLDRPPEDSRAPKPASESELHAAFEAWVALMRGQCMRQPLALVVEDLHQARPATLSLLGHIARNCEDVPLLLLLPMRLDRAEGLLAALQLPPSRCATIELEALELDETRELLSELLDGFAVPTDVVEAVQRFSDGLPGRTEEALDTLTDEGVFRITEEGWTLQNQQLATGLLEKSMSDLLLRRVGRLAPAERSLLDALAVAGESVPGGMLVAMLQREIAERELERLRTAGLITESRTQPFAGQREWQFRHVNLGPMLIESMPRPARADLHKRAAHWLQHWPGQRPPQFGVLLAQHHLQAGDAPEAARHLLRNADDALRAFANRDAFDAYRSAADVSDGWYRADPKELEAQRLLLSALVGMAETGLRVGELELALAATTRAIDVAGDSADLLTLKVRARTVRGQLLDSNGKPDDAIAAQRLAVADARRLPGGFAASILAISHIGGVLYRCGRFSEAVAIADQALQQCKNTGTFNDPELYAGLGRLHTWVGHVASRDKNFGKATSEYSAARASFHRAGDDIGASMADLSLGNVAYRAGQLVEAEAVYRDVSKTCAAMDDIIGVATAETNLGNVLYDQGRHNDALVALRTAEKSQRRMGRLENLPETLRLQALALLARGETQMAQTVATDALAHAERTGQAAAAAAIRDVLKDCVVLT